MATLKSARVTGIVTEATFDAYEQLVLLAKLELNEVKTQQEAVFANPENKATRKAYWSRIDAAASICGEVVKYQRPTFRAVVWGGRLPGEEVAPPSPASNIIDLPADQVTIARVYQRMMGKRPGSGTG